MKTSLLSTLRQYGQQLATEHVELNSFTAGGVSDIMAASRSNLQYPLLWLEIPSLEPQDNGAGYLSAVRPVGLVILDQIGQRTEDDVFDSTEQITLDVLARLRHESRLREFNFDLNKVRVEPVSTLFVDNERGWRISFPLTVGLDLCYDVSRWQEGDVPL